MNENQKQVGGDHYIATEVKCPHCGRGIQHWDIAWYLRWDIFTYIITKWLWRWRRKGGVQDLIKARHALDKYIEMAEKEYETELEGGPTRSYVDQG